MVKREYCDKCGRLSGLQLHLEFGRWRFGWSVHLRRDELFCAADDNHNVASSVPPYDYDADTSTRSLHYHRSPSGNLAGDRYSSYIGSAFAEAEAREFSKAGSNS